MNGRLSSLARRITAIRKEYSKREIETVLQMLEEQGGSSSLFRQLGRGMNPHYHRTQSRQRKKPIHEQRSRAVIMLQQHDPEKYEVLSEFDSLLREGSVLPKVNDIKCLGESLTKDFKSRNSRRDVISKLMEVLASRPLEEIKKVVGAVLTNNRPETEDSDYQRLADFIITGKSRHPRRESEPRSF
ncbi:MAG: hypothetical protein WAM70_09330 [Pyrinomonadaceae bacterium]